MVTCKGCGNFAIREFITRKVICVERQQRETGHDPHHGRGGVQYNFCDSVPFCFVGAYPIHEEVAGGHKVKFVETANRDRDCDTLGKFIPWIDGRTPQEHADMAMLEKVQLLHNQQRQEDIARQEQWRADEERLRKASEAATDKRHNERERRSFVLSVAALIVAILAALISAAATLSTVWLSRQMGP